MSSKLNNTNKTNETKTDEMYVQPIHFGGFPPIIFLGQKNKKIKEFAQLNNNDESFKNISKLNILNIKNILGV
jgi:hypothetical protein